MKFIILMVFFITTAYASKDLGVVTGISITGEMVSCKSDSTPQFCTMEIQIGDLYAYECRQRGLKAHQCACHEFICLEDVQEEQIFIGVDINGDVRGCYAMDKRVKCSEIFDSNDFFAANCREEGNVAIQCGCHDYICVK